MGKIKVTIWNEFVHERDDNPVGDYIRKIYPDGIHEFLKAKLQADDLEIRAVSLDMPDQGLPDDVLNDTDVLMWWGHCAHHLVDDELVAKIRFRVLHGMGLIVMHSELQTWIAEQRAITTLKQNFTIIGSRWMQVILQILTKTLWYSWLHNVPEPI